jgi:cytochrome c556
MIRTVLVMAAVAIGVTAVAAQSDPAAVRQKLMKQTSENRSALNRMLRNQQPYDQAVVDDILKKLIVTAQTIPSVFPPGSYKGPDPKFRYYATAKGLENQADIAARAAALEKALVAAQGKITDVASLKAVWAPINENQCEGCHTTYRARREGGASKDEKE